MKKAYSPIVLLLVGAFALLFIMASALVAYKVTQVGEEPVTKVNKDPIAEVPAEEDTEVSLNSHEEDGYTLYYPEGFMPQDNFIYKVAYASTQTNKIGGNSFIGVTYQDIGETFSLKEALDDQTCNDIASVSKDTVSTILQGQNHQTSIKDLTTYVNEEERTSTCSYTVELYSQDLDYTLITDALVTIKEGQSRLYVVSAVYSLEDEDNSAQALQQSLQSFTIN